MRRPFFFPANSPSRDTIQIIHPNPREPDRDERAARDSEKPQISQDARHRRFSPRTSQPTNNAPKSTTGKYIRPTKISKPFDPRMKIGWAAHEALRNVWKNRRDQIEDPDDLDDFAARHLPERDYPADIRHRWREDVATVAGHIGRALDALDAAALRFTSKRPFRGRFRPIRRNQSRSARVLILYLSTATARSSMSITRPANIGRILTQAVISRVTLRRRCERGLRDARSLTTRSTRVTASSIERRSTGNQSRLIWHRGDRIDPTNPIDRDLAAESRRRLPILRVRGPPLQRSRRRQ